MQSLEVVRDRIVTALGKQSPSPGDILNWLTILFQLLASCQHTPEQALEYLRSPRIFRRRAILREMRRQWATFDKYDDTATVDDVADAALVVVKNCTAREVFEAYRAAGKIQGTIEPTAEQP